MSKTLNSFLWPPENRPFNSMHLLNKWHQHLLSFSDHTLEPRLSSLFLIFRIWHTSKLVCCTFTMHSRPSTSHHFITTTLVPAATSAVGYPNSSLTVPVSTLALYSLFSAQKPQWPLLKGLSHIISPFQLFHHSHQVSDKIQNPFYGLVPTWSISHLVMTLHYLITSVTQCSFISLFFSPAPISHVSLVCISDFLQGAAVCLSLWHTNSHLVTAIQLFGF